MDGVDGDWVETGWRMDGEWVETGWRLGGDWMETGWRMGWENGMGEWDGRMGWKNGMEEWDGRMGWKNGMDGMDGCIVTKVYFVPLGVVVVVVHIIFPDEPENMPDLPLAVDFSHAPQSVLEKAFAPANMLFMLATLDTSHLERSPSNDFAL